MDLHPATPPSPPWRTGARKFSSRTLLHLEPVLTLLEKQTALIGGRTPGCELREDFGDGWSVGPPGMAAIDEKWPRSDPAMIVHRAAAFRRFAVGYRLKQRRDGGA